MQVTVLPFLRRFQALCRSCASQEVYDDDTECVTNIVIVGETIGCFDNPDFVVDPCVFVDCHGHGECVNVDGLGTCECDELFSGSSCEECALPGQEYPDCGIDAVEEDVPLNKNVAIITVVWGVQGAKYVESSNVEESETAVAVYDTTFNITDPLAQAHLAWACDYIRNESSLVQSADGAFECVISDFRDWLSEQQQSYSIHSSAYLSYDFPVMTPTLFMQRISEFVLSSAAGQGSTYQSYIGFDNISAPTKVQYVAFTFYSNIPIYSSGFDIYEDNDAWQQAVDYVNEMGPTTASNAFQTCEQWVSMWTEVIAVTGTLYSIAIVTLVAFLTMYVFTASFLLSVLGITSIVMTLVVIMGVFYLIGWSLGIVEAIGISILLGSAVDYPLHVIESYIDSTERSSKLFAAKLKSPRRCCPCFSASGTIDGDGDTVIWPTGVLRVAYLGRATSKAMVAIGPSIINSAFTTAGCVALLFFCTIEIFVKVSSRHVRNAAAIQSLH